MTTTLTQKGQITIPIEFRRALGLKKGMKCTFMIRDGELILIPLKGPMTRETFQKLFKEGLEGSNHFIARKNQEKDLEL
jgi:AbrB family looped-hinge helix DNA binding protein